MDGKRLTGFVLATGGIVSLTFAAFSVACRYGLCGDDDPFYINGYEFVRNGISWWGIGQAFVFLKESIWMPLTWISYMIDHSIGWGPHGMHFVNIVIHCANAVLVFAFLKGFVRRIERCQRLDSQYDTLVCVLSTLIWAVHPLRVESVVWIASRKDELSTFFFLIALCHWTFGRGSRSVLAALLALVFGAMAKPSVMVFPAFALPLDFLVTKRIKSPAAYTALIFLCGFVALEGSLAQGAALGLSASLPILYKVVNAVAATTIYLGNLVFPRDLAIQCALRYPYWPRFSLVGAAILLPVLAFLFRVVWQRARRFRDCRDWHVLVEGPEVENILLAVLLMFFGGIFPFVGIVGFGHHAFADRFTLLPSLAFSIGLVRILSMRCRSSKVQRCAVVFVGLLAVGLLAGRTILQVRYWENDGKLFGHTLEVDGEANFTAQQAVAFYYWNFDRDLTKVYDHLKRGIELSREMGNPKALMHCCHLLIDAAYALGKNEEAEDYYYLMSKWNYELTGGDSMEFLMAEGLYYANRPGMMDRAEKNLEVLRQKHPNLYDTRYLAYYLAVTKGDEAEIAAALADCYVDPSEDPYCRNDWAR